MIWLASLPDAYHQRSRVRSQRRPPCRCFDHSTSSNKNRGRDAEKRAEPFGLLLRDRALAVDYLRCDSSRAENRLQVYLSEPPNLHVMFQDSIPRRFGDRMMNFFPILCQHRKQVEKTILFRREF